MASLITNVLKVREVFKEIKNALILKGQNPSDKVDTYPNLIKNIEGGVDVSDTTAEKKDVMVGKYFYTSAGVKTEGSAVSGGFDVSDTTATAGDVKSGVEFHTSDGTLVEGTFEGQSKSATPTTNSYTVEPDDGKYLTSVSVEAMPLGEMALTWDKATATAKVTKSGFLYENESRTSSITTNSSGGSYATSANKTLFNKGDRVYFGATYSLPKIFTDTPSNNVVKGNTFDVYSGDPTNPTISHLIFSSSGSYPRSAKGTVTTTSGSTSTVTLGWKPSYVMVLRNRSSSNTMANMYYNGTYLNISTATSSATSNTLITVTSTGFTISDNSIYYGTCYYMAIE